MNYKYRICKMYNPVTGYKEYWIETSVSTVDKWKLVNDTNTTEITVVEEIFQRIIANKDHYERITVIRETCGAW